MAPFTGLFSKRGLFFYYLLFTICYKVLYFFIRKVYIINIRFEEVKYSMMVLTKEIKTKIEDKIDTTDCKPQSGEYWYTWTINEWEKEKAHRLYITCYYGRYHNGQSKWKRAVGYYIDLKNLSIHNNSRVVGYGNAHEGLTCKEIAIFAANIFSASNNCLVHLN